MDSPRALRAREGRAIARDMRSRAVFRSNPQAAEMAACHAGVASGSVGVTRLARGGGRRPWQGGAAAENGGWGHGAVRGRRM